MASLSFMIPLGISLGAVTRVGNLIGEKRFRRAQRAAWVALGMGIATLVAWGRGLRTAAVLALVYFGGRWVYRRYGEQARAAFDQWVNSTQPKAGEVVRAFLQPDQRFGSEGMRH